MLRLRDIYAGRSPGGPPAVSIEIFPPKSPEGDATLFETLDRLVPFQPAFVSCTYGAGGSTRDRTLELCHVVQGRYGLPATAHLTCVGSTCEELLEWIGRVGELGIGNIMALRGDPPQGDTVFAPVPGGLAHASQLVEMIRGANATLGIGVAAYPEVHPEAVSADVDLGHLVDKIQAGADAAFTQLFFVNGSFLRFRDALGARGVDVPLVPGIMPITEFSRIQRIAAMCGSTIPKGLASRLEDVQHDKDAQMAVGVEHAVAQCEELVREGVPGIHFYALNRSAACAQILEALGLTASTESTGER